MKFIKTNKPKSLFLHLMLPTFISSTTQHLQHVTGVSETLPTLSGLLNNYLLVVSMTVPRLSGNVASIHSQVALLSLGCNLRRSPQFRPSPHFQPDINLSVSLPFLVTTDIRSTTSQAPGLMSLPTLVLSSCPPFLSIAPFVSMPLLQSRAKLHQLVPSQQKILR